MARIQYQPASRKKGFQPQQISSAGISRMREESNRLIQGLENNRRAEMEQRDREFQALQSDAAYTERITKENRDIELQNLQNEQAGKLAGIEEEQKQAQYDAEAFKTIVGTLGEFSESLGKLAQARTAKMQKDQATLAANLAADFVNTPQYQEWRDAAFAQIKGGIAYNAANAQDGIESGRSRLQTLISQQSNPGLGAYGRRVLENEILKKNFIYAFENNQQGTEKVYTAPDGRKFSGVETIRNRSLYESLAQQTRQEVFSYLGIVEPGSYGEALTAINSFVETGANAAANNQEKFVLDNIEHRAKTLESTGTVEGITAAFSDRMTAFGAAKAHDGIAALADNTSIPLEIVQNLKLKGDKIYAEEWGKNRWPEFVQRRNKAIVNERTLENKLEKAEEAQWQVDNIANIREAYQQNPKQAAMIMQERYHSRGMTLPTLIKEIESSAFKKAANEAKNTLEVKARAGILDLNFVNRLPPNLREQGAKLLKAQEERKYGPEALGIKKGFRATARKLTGIDPNEGNDSPLTFLVQARLEREYKKALEQTQDPKAALEIVNDLLDKGANLDKTSPFYKETGTNNRLTFPNIQSSSADRKQMNDYIDKQMLKYGTETVNRPFSLANSDEMDAAYQSSIVPGSVMQYPPGIIRFADQYNFKYSEVFNAVRKTNNAATGENKPLLQPSLITDFVDEQSPDIRHLLLSGNSSQVSRGLATATGSLNNNLRASIGGATVSNKENAFIQTIRTVEGTSGSQGYNTVYGGAVVPQLTQMTLGELYDAIKLGGTDAIPERLGGGKIPFKKDKYNSSASGALQLMPETLRGLVDTGAYSWNDTFSPETQDRMILDLARQGGVDIENMSPAQMEKAGNIWAGASPKYGQTSRTASDTYNIYQSLLQQ